MEVEGHALKLSNLDKILYPEAGFTKAEVLDYYARIAPVLLPHLGDRYVTLKRYPDGVESQPFFEKNCPSFKPDWMDVHPMDDIRFCAVDSLAALTWVANLAALELHTSMARWPDAETPTMVVFDLDPGAPAGLAECVEVALWIRHVLRDLGLECVVKTSGSKGMQLYLPLNSLGPTHDSTAGFSRTLAQLLEQTHPDLVVSVQRKDLRAGKVLVDWSQNSRHKTTVCAYSLRARERPTVSTPLTWDEVEQASETGDVDALVFEAPEVLDRVATLGDVFAPARELRQELPKLP